MEPCENIIPAARRNPGFYGGEAGLRAGLRDRAHEKLRAKIILIPVIHIEQPILRFTVVERLDNRPVIPARPQIHRVKIWNQLVAQPQIPLDDLYTRCPTYGDA